MAKFDEETARKLADEMDVRLVVRMGLVVAPPDGKPAPSAYADLPRLEGMTACAVARMLAMGLHSIRAMAEQIQNVTGEPMLAMVLDADYRMSGRQDDIASPFDPAEMPVKMDPGTHPGGQGDVQAPPAP